MRLSVHVHQPPDVEVRVALGRAELRLAEQFLDRAEVGAGAEQVRGERVAKRVRADALWDAGCAGGRAHDAIDAAGRQPLAAEVQEERIPSTRAPSHRPLTFDL